MSNEVTSAAAPQVQRSGVILRNVMHIGMGQIVSTALGFVLTAALARTLGAADFGTYIIIFTIYGFVYVLIDWGQATYVVAQIARGNAEEPRFIGAALLIRTAGTLCASAVAAAIALGFGYRDSIAILAPLMVLIGLPGALGQSLGYVFRGKNRMDVEAFIAIVGKAVGVVAALLALYWGGKVFEVVVAWAIGGLGWLVAALFYTRRFGIKFVAPPSAEFEHHVRLGAPLAASAFVFALQSLIDVWLLSRLTAAEAVGWYGAAKAVVGLVGIPAVILAGASFPEVARASSSVAEFRRVLVINARVLLVVGACAASCMFLFADYIVIAIYGRGQFEKTTQLVRASCPFLPLLSVGFLLGNATAAVGRMKEVALAKVVFIAVTSIIAWYSIGYCQARFGNGAIALMLVSGLAEGWMLLCFAYLLPRGAVTKGMVLDMLRAIAAMAFTLFPLWVLKPMPVWLLGPLCLGLFAAVAWALGLVRQADIDKMRQLLERKNIVLSQTPA
jgi:O-antigen/teichoic acid export membrane protein